ncbi:MAG: bifunctional aspartate kinase/diaminopimelate decarboxylase [Legionellaceae bacterium]|nr:bifunctional aspartate kinase/diaminopimelate decarboxylase [Legionellaceae bacterium]
MDLIIAKFGGTSVSTRQNWDNILTIAKNHIENGNKPIIVCSALSQASNKLEKMIELALHDKHQQLHDELVGNYYGLATELGLELDLISDELDKLDKWLTGIALLKQAPSKTYAQIMSLGELMVTRLGQAFLNKKGMSSMWIDARDALKSLPMSSETPNNYGSSRCNCDFNQELSDELRNSTAEVIITQGFIASNAEGETVLLGRGGSDTSAALFAAILKASVCEIWTDVAGIYTANPHQLPHARLLKKLNYDEAQEISSMGAKVIHPLCIPPVRSANIPMDVKCSHMPDHCGTRIHRDSDTDAPPIKSVLAKHTISLISIDTVSMWQKPGFLADVFTLFKKHKFSVDLLATSESNITISLDDSFTQPNRVALDFLLADLNSFCRAKIIEPCSAVSLIGHDIRRVLPQLGSTLELFDDKQVHLMSLASNDLNLTFVVDESQSEKLCQNLHSLLIENNPQSFYYSKSWHEEFGNPKKTPTPWWEEKRGELLDLAVTESPCYVYDKQTQDKRTDDLLSIKSIDKIFYAIKANSNKKILQNLHAKNIGFECVSIQEIDLILSLFPEISRSNILFTPNFASKSEYEYALSKGCYLTVDNLYPLKNWPEIFKNMEIILRIDPGCGAGHHKFVCTGGNESKFGIPNKDLDVALSIVNEYNIKVIGLHSHSGSGILSSDLWQETALMLAHESERFPDVKYLNLGGGLGITEKPGQQSIDLESMDESLMSVKNRYPKLSFWLEPGRYFVAESGVLLAKVTQTKEKGRVHFIGIETGMNSLMRPMLYGAYHNIVNLSCFKNVNKGFAHIVGPICESGDTLGYNRMMPETTENDIILIANTGAYGYCMSSTYNLRTPAQEIFLD